MKNIKKLKGNIIEMKLINADKVFENEITRITPRDFVNISDVKKHLLTKKEKEQFEDFGMEHHGLSLIGESDVLVKRKGKHKIKIIPF